MKILLYYGQIDIVQDLGTFAILSVLLVSAITIMILTKDDDNGNSKQTSEKMKD